MPRCFLNWMLEKLKKSVPALFFLLWCERKAFYMESQDYTTRSGSLKRSSSFKKLLKLPNWGSSSSGKMFEIFYITTLSCEVDFLKCQTSGCFHGNLFQIFFIFNNLFLFLFSREMVTEKIVGKICYFIRAIGLVLKCLN